MIDHLYDRGVRTIGPLCHANGIAWRRDRKRLQREVPSSLFSLSPSLSLSLSFSLVPFQRPRREHRLLARARPTTRVNLVCIWSGPVRLAGVQSMDVIHCSLPTESQADGRTYVCMYVCMDGRAGEGGREERNRGRDTTRSPPKTLDRWRRYGYQSLGNRTDQLFHWKFIPSIVIYSLDPFSAMMGIGGRDNGKSFRGFGFFFKYL